MLSPKHKNAARQNQIFLNIYQPAHDRRLASIARKMRNEGLIYDTYVRPNGLTTVVPNGSKKKVRIYDDEDLETFSRGRNIEEFDVSTTNLEDA